MTIYEAYFYTDDDYAIRAVEADTPEQALALARKFYDEQAEMLDFQNYDGRRNLNEIQICLDHDFYAEWQSDDLRLRLAAQDLLDVAELVVARWCTGDLADAVRQLDAAIAKAKGGAA